MTTPEEMELYYSTVLEIEEEETITALFEQGLDTMDGFNHLRLEDISRICSNIRRPGGMMVDDNGDLVPNRGTPISVLIETRLKQLWFFFRYAYMTQREPDFADDMDVPTLEVLADLDSWISSFDDPKDVEKPPTFPGQEKAKKWFESFDEFADRTKGPSGVPLGYVLREQHHIPADDTGWFLPGMDEDLFNRGRHPVAGVRAALWMADNTVLWNMLKHTVHPTNHFTWLKAFEKTKNGNAAYWALKHVMLGPGVTRALRARADAIIQTTKYDGKAKGYSFDKMVTRLTQAFIDSDIDWDEERKVQKLLQAIDDSTLLAAKHAIMASPTLRVNYQDTVNYLQELVSIRDQHPGSLLSRGIAAAKKASGDTKASGDVEASGDDEAYDEEAYDEEADYYEDGEDYDGEDYGDDEDYDEYPPPLEEWDPSQPGAYYSKEAYDKLTPEQKDLHWEAREEAKSAAKDDTGSKGKRDSSQISALMAIQAERDAKIAQLTTDLAVARALAEHQGTVSIGATISNKRRPGIGATSGTPLYKREENGDFTRVF